MSGVVSFLPAFDLARIGHNGKNQHFARADRFRRVGYFAAIGIERYRLAEMSAFSWNARSECFDYVLNDARRKIPSRADDARVLRRRESSRLAAIDESSILDIAAERLVVLPVDFSDALASGLRKRLAPRLREKTPLPAKIILRSITGNLEVAAMSGGRQVVVDRQWTPKAASKPISPGLAAGSTRILISDVFTFSAPNSNEWP